MKYLDTTLKVLACLFLLAGIVAITDHEIYRHTGFECEDGYRIHSKDLDFADDACFKKGHGDTLETLEKFKNSPPSPSEPAAPKDSNVKPFVVPGIGDTPSAPSGKDGDE